MDSSSHDRLSGVAPPRRRIDPAAVRQAFTGLIEALGIADVTDHRTAYRATTLWLDHLMVGLAQDLKASLGPALSSDQSAPISIEPMGFHLVCPHHLTIASGTASIAYWPTGRIVGFGRLANLVQIATCRPALQENVAADIAKTLMQVTGAKAVTVRLRAEHPCHTILQPASHGARATTWAFEGDSTAALQLQGLLGP